MKKLSRIIVCFALVIALVLSTAACKPAKPTPAVTTTPTPVVTATPTPEKTPAPVTPTPAPTKKPGGSLTFPDGWDKPIDTKKDVTAEQASALTDNGTYYLNAKSGDSVENEAFTGTIIVDNKEKLTALTLNMPNASIEFRGEIGTLNVTSGQHTARFTPSSIIDVLNVLGGNVLAEALAEIKALDVPVENTTTSNVQLLGAVLTTFSTNAPINLTFKAPATAQAQAPTFTNSASGTVLEVIGSITSLAVTNTTDKSLVVDVTNATQATGEKLTVANSGTVLVVGEKPATDLIGGTGTPATKLETIAGLAVSADPTFAISGTDKLTTSFAVTATANFGTKDIKGVVVELYAGDKLVSANEMTAKGLAEVFATPAQTFTIATSEFFPIATTDASGHWTHSAALITAGAKPTKIKVVVTPHVGTAVSNEKVLETPLDDAAYKAIFDKSVIAKDLLQADNIAIFENQVSTSNLTYKSLCADFNFKDGKKLKDILPLTQSITGTLKFKNGKTLTHNVKLSVALAEAGDAASFDFFFYGTDGLEGDVKAFRTWLTSAPIITKEMGEPESITMKITDKLGNVSEATSPIISQTELAKFPSIFTDVKVNGTKTIASGETLTIPAGVILTIPDGATLTNNGTIVVNDLEGFYMVYYAGGNVKLNSDLTLTEAEMLPETATLIIAAGKTLTIGSNGRIYAKGTVRNEGNIIATSQGTGDDFDGHTLQFEEKTGLFYQIDATNSEYNAVPYIAGSSYTGTDAVFKVENWPARITTNKTPGGNGKMNISFKDGVVKTQLTTINVRTNIIFDYSTLSHTTAGTTITINVLGNGSFDYNGNIFTAGQTIKITDGKVPTAKIGKTEYSTLEEALTAAQSGNTVDLFMSTTLKADATVKTGVTLKIPANKTLTLGNGVELTIALDAKLENEGKITNLPKCNNCTIRVNNEASFRSVATSGFYGYVFLDSDIAITEDLTTNNTYFTLIAKDKTLTVETGKTLSFTGKLEITSIGTIKNKGRIETNGNPINIRSTGSYYNLNSAGELVPYLVNKTVADSNTNNNEEFVFSYEATLFSNAIGGNRGMDCQFNSNVVMKDDTLTISTNFSFYGGKTLKSVSGQPVTLTLEKSGSFLFNGTTYASPAVTTITIDKDGVLTSPYAAVNTTTGAKYSSITEAINNAAINETVELRIDSKLTANATLLAGAKLVIKDGISLDLRWYSFKFEDKAVQNNGTVVVSSGGENTFNLVNEKIGGNIAIKSDVALTSATTIASGTHLTIAPNGNLTINAGAGLTVKDGGSVTNNGKIKVNDVDGLKDASLIGGYIEFWGSEKGAVTLNNDITIKSGSTLSINGSGYQIIIPSGITLTIDKGATLNVIKSGKVTVQAGGKLIRNGTINVDGTGQIVEQK